MGGGRGGEGILLRNTFRGLVTPLYFSPAGGSLVVPPSECAKIVDYHND